MDESEKAAYLLGLAVGQRKANLAIDKILQDIEEVINELR